MEHDQLTLQPLQKCTERANASDDLADIVQLVNDGVHANYHYGHDRLPAIHLLCHRWVTMSGKETSQWLRAFDSLLALGVDVALEDAEGNTVLHTAVSCRCPASAITHLVERTHVNVNKKNKSEETALHILLSKEQKVDREVLRSLVRGGADVTVVGKDEQTPLHLLLDKPERECMSLMNIVQEYQHTFAMLHCIVMLGTEAQMNMLLKQCDRRGNKVNTDLIVTAASSSSIPCRKIEILMTRGLSISTVCLHTGDNILHRAVSSGNIAVLKMALQNGVPQIPDNNGDLPIHIAAGSVGTVEPLSLLLSPKLENAKNRAKATPLSLAVRNGNKDKVELLIQCGCMPEKSKMLKFIPHETLSMLAKPAIIAQSPQPLMFCLQMVTTFRNASEVQELNKEECLATANQMVSIATDLVNGSKIFPSDDVISYGIDQKIKEFIACCTVQKHLTHCWYACDQESGIGTLCLIRNIIIYYLLFPFLALRTLPRSIREFINMKRSPIGPYVQYMSYIISYIIFLIILVTHVVCVKSQPRCKNQHRDTGCKLNTVDWILSIYVVALNVEGLSHMKKLRLKSRSIATYDDILTALSTILLNVYFIISIVCFYGNFSVSAKSKAIRVAFYFLSVGLACSFYHFLQMAKSHSVLGPIQISIEHLLMQTVGYLVYLIFQLIIMSSVITGIYGAELQSLGMMNETKPLLLAAKSRGVRYRNRPHAPASEGFGKAIEYFYFSMFGLANLDDFMIDPKLSPQSTEEIIAIILFGIWLTAFSIFFLSMVVAFVTNAYQTVQANSEIERKFAKAVIIRRLLVSPPLPVPLNILYYTLQILSCNFARQKVSHHKTQWSEDQTIDATDSVSQKQMMNCFLENVNQKNEDSAVTKKDFNRVYSEINNLKVCIANRPSLPTSQSCGKHYELDNSPLQLKLRDSLSPFAASMTRLAESVLHLETRLSTIERKFDDTIV